MIGTITDLNKIEASITFEDGTTLDIGRIQLPQNIKRGQKIDIPEGTIKITNDKLTDFF